MLLVVGVLMTTAAFPCWAFNAATRKEMLKDTLEFMPPDLKTYLWANWEYVNEGLLFDYRNNSQADPLDIGNVYDTLVGRLKESRLTDGNTARGFGVLACLHQQFQEQDHAFRPVQFGGGTLEHLQSGLVKTQLGC